MKKITLLILLLSIQLVAQDNTNKKLKLKDISGIVIYDNLPLTNVNILVKNTEKGTSTNSRGAYIIKAKEGDILQFTHLNMKSIEVLIEDVTGILNIDMVANENYLDEITIISKNDKKKGIGLKTPRKFSSARYNLDTRKAGFATAFIKGDDLNLAASSIGVALRGKVSGLTIVTGTDGTEYARLRETGFTGTAVYALWDVDGTIYKEAPILDLNDIKDVAVIKSLAGTNRYGSDGAGGVIIITTKSNSARAAIDINSPENKYTNKNYYNNDAIPIDAIQIGKPDYYTTFAAINDVSLAYEKYKEIYDVQKNKSNFHFNVVNYFVKNYKDRKYAAMILSDLEIFSNDNPENLKAIAYKYQQLKLHKNALSVYKKMMKIRPKHAQSFRDLATAYTHLGEYKSAWKIYRYYLQKGFKIEDNSIGEMINTEMRSIYVQRKNEVGIKEVMKLNSNDLNIENDVRVVFEWNTSEAEFILEFVNPNKQVYEIEHSLSENSQLILDEKMKGYNSKEFLIEKVEKDWLVNITYLGNKKYVPTFLKVTTYYNWGRSNERAEVKVHELTLKNVKANLITLP